MDLPLVLTWTILLSLVSWKVQSANILGIFPTASYSHQVPVLAITKALAQRGHNLTVITPNPQKELVPNYTDIDISFSYDFVKPKNNETPKLNLHKKQSIWSVFFELFPASQDINEVQLNSTQVQNFIKYVDKEKPKFDLVIFEQLIYTSYLGILPKLGHPPLIGVYTIVLPCGLDYGYGMVCNPSTVPDFLLGYTDQMTFWQRVKNYLLVALLRFIFNPWQGQNQEYLMQKYFGVSSPTSVEMARNTSLLFLSSNWLNQYSRPIFPKTILLGPLHISSTKTLPEDLLNWVEGAKEGVIYFSLGSNVQSASLEESKRNAIVQTFKRFPNHRIIWKWEGDVLPSVSSNVLCRKWLPQHDLLAHKNIKLFVNQGGLQSSQEAVHFAVPVVGIPFFFDQDFNIQRLQYLGAGLMLELEDMNEDTLYEKMHQVLYNNSYKEQMDKLSTISKLQMMSPIDSAVWWVEYVLKTGGDMKHLGAQHLYDKSVISYHGIDVITFLIAIACLVLLAIYRLTKKLISLLCVKCFKHKTVKEKKQ